jgi:CRP-like cAMP-binding protein
MRGAWSREDVEALAALGVSRRYRKGTILFHEGDAPESVIVVRAGRVKISSFTEDGKEVVLAVREPGQLLGELSAIDGEHRSATATAMENVDAAWVPAGVFRSFLAGQPGAAFALLEVMSAKLRDADRKRIEFGAYDTTGRVARRLVEMADRFGETSGDGVRITLPLSQQELAGWTGSSREAVSKSLHQLRARGFIETARRGITVLDLAGLRRRAT